MANMDIYNAVRKPPEEALKPFSNGSFSGTDINPMWRIEKLTEMFGAAGIGWYTEVLSERAETYGDTVMAIVDINLYVKIDGEWSKPIFGTGGNLLVQVTKSGARPSDEGYKKAYTDALSIACKALGIGADIWFSKSPTAYDPTSKYADKYIDIKATPADRTPPANYEPPKETAKAKVTVGSMGYTCDICHKQINGVARSNGELVTPDEIVKNTRKSGKTLCIDCYKSWEKVNKKWVQT